MKIPADEIFDRKLIERSAKEMESRTMQKTDEKYLFQVLQIFIEESGLVFYASESRDAGAGELLHDAALVRASAALASLVLDSDKGAEILAGTATYDVLSILFILKTSLVSSAREADPLADQIEAFIDEMKWGSSSFQSETAEDFFCIMALEEEAASLRTARKRHLIYAARAEELLAKKLSG